MNFCKNKFLNILLNILLIGVLPLCLGFLMFFYIEYAIMLICIIPGFIAFFGSALKNGGDNGK